MVDEKEKEKIDDCHSLALFLVYTCCEGFFLGFFFCLYVCLFVFTANGISAFIDLEAAPQYSLGSSVSMEKPHVSRQHT